MTNSVRHESGQALAELVLIVPLLLLILLGAIDVGRYMFSAIETGNAARAGVQYGGQNLFTSGDATRIATAAQNDAGEVAGLAVSASNYCTCDSAPGTHYANCTAMPACSSGDHADLYVQVDVSKSFAPLISYPGIPNPITVTRTAVQQLTP